MELLIELLAVKAEMTRKASWEQPREPLTNEDLEVYMLDEVKYPNVKVKLVGQDGNAFAILGRTQRAMKAAGLTSEQIDEFMNEAKSKDYDNLLATVMKYVDVDDGDVEESDDK